MAVVYKSKEIAFNQITILKQFVDEASKVEDEVSLQSDYYVVNAKSIMGVMSLDTSKGVTVCYPAYAHDFELFLEPFEMKE